MIWYFCVGLQSPALRRSNGWLDVYVSPWTSGAPPKGSKSDRWIDRLPDILGPILFRVHEGHVADLTRGEEETWQHAFTAEEGLS